MHAIHADLQVPSLSTVSLADLALADHPACVSLYMPALVDRESRQDPIRFANLLAEAQGRLYDQGLGPAAIAARIDPLRQIAGVPEWWRDKTPGLAFFADDGGVRPLLLPEPVEERVAVTVGFELTPLAPLVAPDGAYDLLILDQDGARLFHGSRHRLQPRDLPETPGIDDQGWRERLDRVQQAAAGHHAPGGAGQRAHLDHQVEGGLAAYFRRVDAAVRAAAGGDPPPLVLCGQERLVGLYRRSSRHPHLAERAVERHASLLRHPDHVRRLAWEVVAPRYDHLASDLAAARAQAAKGSGARGEAAVASCLAQGRVEALFVVAPRGGEDATGTVAAAVRAAIRTGARIHVLGRGGVPGGAGMAALLRW